MRSVLTTKDKMDIARYVVMMLKGQVIQVEKKETGKEVSVIDDSCDYQGASEILERSKDWISRNKWIPRIGKGKQTRFIRSLLYAIKANGYKLPDDYK